MIIWGVEIRRKKLPLLKYKKQFGLLILLGLASGFANIFMWECVCGRAQYGLCERHPDNRGSDREFVGSQTFRRRAHPAKIFWHRRRYRGSDVDCFAVASKIAI